MISAIYTHEMSVDAAALWALVDTNILLHYRWLEDWDWTAPEEGLRFVFVPLVFRELEKRQYQDTSERLRGRARSMLRKLSELFDAGPIVQLRNGMIAEALPNEPLLSFADYSLSREVADDYLIAHLIEAHSKGRKAALVSADGPAAFKAKLRGFNVIRPEQKWQLPLVASKEERELQLLRAEKNAQPKLSLTICGAQETESILYSLELLRQWTQDDKSKLLRRLTRNLPTIPGSKNLTHADISLLRDNEEIINQRSNYIDESDRYRRLILLELPLAISNSGARTAENVHVRIQFQAQGSVAEKVPKPPQDPEDEPGPYEKYIEDIVPPAVHMAELAGKRARLEMLMTGEDGTHTAEISVGQARQEYTTALIPLYLVFARDDLAHSFNIKWEIRASNLGATVRGQMNVKVEKTVKDVDADAPKLQRPQPMMS